MSDEVSALVSVPHNGFPWSLATMNESSHSQGTPAYLGSLIPPLFPPLSLSEMTRALRAKVRSSGRAEGGLAVCPREFFGWTPNSFDFPP